MGKMLQMGLFNRKSKMENKAGYPGRETEQLMPGKITKEKCGFQIGNTHHIGRRNNQQDSFAISNVSEPEYYEEKGVFAVVADGMGGLSHGEDISAIVASSMLRYFNETPMEEDTGIRLLHMLTFANDQVNQYLYDGEKDLAGSTVVSVIIKNQELYWLSVGDSRIYLIRNKTVLQLNREHIYQVDLDEKASLGEISYDEAKNDPQRSALTSYIGMGTIEKIDRNIRPLMLAPQDRLLLMSDGIFGALSDEEILSAMNMQPMESAARIEQMILEKNLLNQDNFTGVIIEID